MSTPSQSPMSQTLSEARQTVIRRSTRGDRPVLVRSPREAEPAPDVLARLRYGAAIEEALDVPGVTRLISVEADGSSLALVLDDFGGRSLRSVLAAGRLEITEAVRIATEIARALGELHRRRIAHKGIEPSVILLNPETGEVRITNFDAASRLDREEPLLAAGEGQGALAYLAPEQTGRMNRAVDYRADLYALGVTLYEMLTGRVPFEAQDPAALVHAHLALAPVPPEILRPSVPRALSDVVRKLLAKSPEDRYQSAEGAISDLSECFGHLAEGATLASFQLGRNDVPPSFRLPQKLYGRSHEKEALVAAFERASRGRAELFVVTGPSGAGKTTLVNELRAASVREHGYFCAGECDPVRAAPYDAIRRALGNLCAEILVESRDRAAILAARILADAGPGIDLLLGAIPELSRLLGPDASPRRAQAGGAPSDDAAPFDVGAAGSPLQARDRFDLAFQQLIGAVARREHPLAIFLDDLHWADEASLRLVHILLRDPGVRHLFVVAAMEPLHDGAPRAPAETLAAVRGGPTPVHELALGPLGEGDVAQLVADGLVTRDDAPPRALVSFLLETTGGNPLFVHQLLDWLHAAGLLRMDTETGRWACSLESLQGGSVAGGPRALFEVRMSGLAPASARALAVAACFGARFDLAMVARASGETRYATASSLWPAVEAGLIHPFGGAYRGAVADPPSDVSYAFAHPVVHAAALARIPPAERRDLRIRAGRLLLSETTGDGRDPGAAVFDIADLLGESGPLLESPEDRIELARIQLAAGERACHHGAHAAASRYLAAGTALLPPEGTGSAPRSPPRASDPTYPLAFALHRCHAVCAHIEGRTAEAEAELGELSRRARTEGDRTLVSLLQGMLAQSRGDYLGAARIGIEALARRGVTFPDADGIAAENAAVDAALAGRSIDGLLDAPVTSDPDERACVALLALVLLAAARCDLARFRLAGAVVVARSLRYGHAPFSSLGYAAHDVAGGARRADLVGFAMKLSERLDGPGVRAAVQILGAVSTSRVRPLAESLAPLEQAIERALAAGDMPLAGLAAVQRLVLGLLSGEDLYTLQHHASTYLDLLRRVGQTAPALIVDTMGQAIHRLTSGAPVSSSDGTLPGAREGDAAPPPVEASGDAVGTVTVMLFSVHRALLFGDPARALVAAARTGPALAEVQGHPIEAAYRYYHAVALAGVHGSAPPEERAAILDQVVAHRDRLKTWADGCAANYLHRYLLVAAEAARLAGDERGALDLYDQAVASGEEHNNAGAALASERAGRFHLAAGRRHIARAYLLGARAAFARWGADAKAADLSRAFPEQLPAEATAQLEGAAAAPSDLRAVLRLSQAISAELDLDALLHRLMAGVLEVATARRGLLLLPGFGAVEAVAPSLAPVEAARGASLRPAEPLRVVRSPGSFEDRDDLAWSVVRHVKETRQIVVLEHAAADGPFRSDPYVVRARPRSVLCLPVAGADAPELSGLLYLENNLVAGAFTPSIVDAVATLSSQAAISLENARAHQTLARRAAAEAEELGRMSADLSGSLLRVQDAQKRLLVQEKLATLGGLTAGIAHEIKNPLNFINNFAESSVGIADEALAELRGQRARMDEDAASNLEDLIGDLGKNAAKINEHGRRAEEIVRSMLEHSRGGSAAARMVDVNALLKEYVNLAYQGFRSLDPSFNTSIEASYAQGLAPLRLVPQDLGRVFLNLVNNACYAVHAKKKSKGGRFSPALRISTRDLGHAVQIRVRDNGTGIPPKVKDKIFDPFFTTKPTGDGTGLGLSISHDIVRSTGGTLEVETEDGEFTEFVITLPRKES